MTIKTVIKTAVVICLIGGCTITGTPKTEHVGLIEREVNIDLSHRTQRNLNTPWRQRRYLTATPAYAKQVAANSAERTGVSKSGLIDRALNSRILLAEKTQHNNDDRPIKLSTNRSSHHPLAFTLESPSSVTGDRYRGSSDLSVVYTVPFARRVEVLGPKGRNRTSSITEIAKHSSRVILQGVVSGENSDSRKDQLSIGRSLSVRKFMTLHGVQRSKFTILDRKNTYFRSSKEDGNYVEVRFDA